MDGRKRPWWDYADNLLNSDIGDIMEFADDEVNT